LQLFQSLIDLDGVSKPAYNASMAPKTPTAARPTTSIPSLAAAPDAAPDEAELAEELVVVLELSLPLPLPLVPLLAELAAVGAEPGTVINVPFPAGLPVAVAKALEAAPVPVTSNTVLEEPDVPVSTT